MQTGAGHGPILLLGGGQSLLPGMDFLAHRLERHDRLLILPYALPDSRFAECFGLVQALFAKVGVTRSRLAIADDIVDAARHLRCHAAVYLCGGNTFTLLAAMRASRLIPALTAYRAAGGIVVGNSAGAIVLGHTIHHAHDPNHIGLRDFRGCDWLSGYSVWCHYSSSTHDHEIETVMLSRGERVLALSNDAAVVLGPRGLETCPGATAPRLFE